MSSNENHISIEHEIEKSYLEYSLSVIVGRAIPDIRDGLKPVHRRILFAMHELSNTYNRPYKKSARIVGDVIGKYHPHGDSAVYDALVRLAQDFNMRDPLVDGQGNFGSIDGDSAAAMRYTESRMSRLAGEFLTDIEKNTVDFRPNYDNSLQEPEVLPTRVPNLLINGSSGIAVGMATNIPPHNLNEVVRATIHLLDNPQASIDDLCRFIPGPDFPTGAYIYGQKGLREAYHTGRGSVKIRAKIEVETRKNNQERIVIREIPYALNKTALLEKIAQLINDGRIEGVSDLRDETSLKGMRIVLDLKKTAYSEITINQLYKYTPLQTSFGINMMAVVNNSPRLLNLKDILELFLAFRKEVVLRRTRFELDKAQKRAHILEGLKMALDAIDKIITLIRGSKTPAEAKTGLMEQFDFSEVQAQAILDMRLQRLTNLEREKLLEELRQLLQTIEYLNSILSNREVLHSVIREELNELRSTFATERRSVFLDHDPEQLDAEDIIPDDDVVITLSNRGYMKRTALSNYHQQKRGGKGIIGAQVSDQDFIANILATSNHQFLNLFTNRGRMFQIKVHQVPEGGRTAKGVHIANLVPLDKDENVAAVMAYRELPEDRSFFFITRNGVVKRSLMSLYRNIRTTGLIALGLRDNDELIAVREVDNGDEALLVTRGGYGIRFACNEVRAMGRSASGVKGIALRPNDYVVTGVIATDETKALMTIAEKGYGKRTQLEEFRAQSRGGKGIINMRVTPKTGSVIGAMMVDDESEVLLLTSANKLIRINVNEIRLVGRATQGVLLVRLEDEQKVICFDQLEKEDGEDVEQAHPEASDEDNE